MLFALYWFSVLGFVCLAEDLVAPPSVQVKNGTIIGRHLQGQWNQDAFLGVPFAQPPVRQLRFKRPRELNQSFAAPLNASNYGPSCFGYGNALLQPIEPRSEDCLTLNVIRPHGAPTNTTLPVLVWIYGGGFFTGASADPQYNLSGLVRTAQEANKPFIAVSINYRTGPLGFFQTPQVFADGDSNAGLQDQRLALKWIQENIGAFGGDPHRVTIWGESAGAESIALHLHSYDGRDDGLYSGAILESGSFFGTPLMPPSYYAPQVQNLTARVGCGDASRNPSEVLNCLRGVSADVFYNTYTQNSIWNPIVDGDYLTDYPSVLANAGKSVKVPILIGANTDEGLLFAPRVGLPYAPASLDTDTDLFNTIVNDYGSGFPGYPFQITPLSAKKLLELYPNDPANEPPYDVKNGTISPQLGRQWRRAAGIYGDLIMIATRRRMSEQYAAQNQPVYSYRFDTRAWNATLADGVPHFVNVAFSFQNITGLLGPLPQFESHRQLSKNIGRAYANFVHDRDPNGSTKRAIDGSETESSVDTGLPYWPRYTLDKPVNIVLNATKVFVEQDNFRKEGIIFINSIARSDLLG